MITFRRTPSYLTPASCPRQIRRHRQALHAHARHRLWERYGISPSPIDLETMASLIRYRKPQALLVWQQSQKRGIWAVSFKGQHLFAIYDTVLQAIATFLTEDMLRILQPEALGSPSDPLAIARGAAKGCLPDPELRQRLERARDFIAPREWFR